MMHHGQSAQLTENLHGLMLQVVFGSNSTEIGNDETVLNLVEANHTDIGQPPSCRSCQALTLGSQLRVLLSLVVRHAYHRIDV